MRSIAADGEEKVLERIIKLLISFALLFLMLYLGKLMVYVFPIGIPDSILGMLLLLICLMSGIIKVEWIMPGGRLLTRYMTLFFLPICVELMEHFDVLKQNINSLVLSNILSTAVSLVAIGLFAQWIFLRTAKKRRKNREK